jgi:hypothetical protein
MISYRNPYPVAFPEEPHAPVPGWGFTPNLAGPAMLAVGDDVGKVSFDIAYEPSSAPVHGVGQDPISTLTQQQALAAWGAIQPGVAALLDDQRGKMQQALWLLGGTMVVTALLAAAWIRKG